VNNLCNAWRNAKEEDRDAIVPGLYQALLEYARKYSKGEVFPNSGRQIT